MKQVCGLWYRLSLQRTIRQSVALSSLVEPKIVPMEKMNEADFPSELQPTDLPTANTADTTSLVWDFCSDNDRNQKKGHVKIYLKTPAKEKEEASEGTAVPEQIIEDSPSSAATDKATTAPQSAEEGENTEEVIEASVLQYQRQLRKTQAAKRAGAVLKDAQLEAVFEDESIAVVNKPAGVLCVPGIHNNDSIANLLFARQQQQAAAQEDLCPDACSMAVHRLDMDTSGLVVFGKTKSAVSTLHQVFRRETPAEQQSKKKKKRKRKKRQKPGEANNETNEKEESRTTNTTENHQTVVKEYEALVCGHLPLHIESGHIDLPLQRDVHHPPFMRVSTPHSEALARQVVDALRKRNWTKLTKRNPKQSQTLFRVLGREYYSSDHHPDDDNNATTSSNDAEEKPPIQIPVTRLSMIPITGRTHQLRVHCAAMGFPIVGDPVYGIYGESAFCGGLWNNRVGLLQQNAESADSENWRASIALQKQMMELHPPGVKDMCLHAKKLGFPHPVTRSLREWEVPPKF